jgi:hypothetical protein
MERSLLRTRPANFADCPATVDTADEAPTASNPAVWMGASDIVTELEKIAFEEPDGD